MWCVACRNCCAGKDGSNNLGQPIPGLGLPVNDPLFDLDDTPINRVEPRKSSPQKIESPPTPKTKTNARLGKKSPKTTADPKDKALKRKNDTTAKSSLPPKQKESREKTSPPPPPVSSLPVTTPRVTTPRVTTPRVTIPPPASPAPVKTPPQITASPSGANETQAQSHSPLGQKDEASQLSSKETLSPFSEQKSSPAGPTSSSRPSSTPPVGATALGGGIAIAPQGEAPEASPSHKAFRDCTERETLAMKSSLRSILTDFRVRCTEGKVRCWSVLHPMKLNTGVEYIDGIDSTGRQPCIVKLANEIENSSIEKLSDDGIPQGISLRSLSDVSKVFKGSNLVEHKSYKVSDRFGPHLCGIDFSDSSSLLLAFEKVKDCETFQLSLNILRQSRSSDNQSTGTAEASSPSALARIAKMADPTAKGLASDLRQQLIQIKEDS